jgi:uncharacterized protein (TIGR00251 family)
MRDHIKDGYLRVKVKPGQPRQAVVGWDDTIGALRVNLHAKAEDNKANIELLKMMRKILKEEVRIASGATSREKLLRIG